MKKQMYSKIIFKFNKEKDLYNNWETCNRKSRFADFASRMPPPILKITKRKKYSSCKKQLEKYLKEIYNSNSIKIFEKAINQAWKSIEKEYFERVERITEKPLKIKKITGYITTASRCPYSFKEKWFMIKYFSSIANALQIAGHEILHFHFYKNYWKQIEKEIGRDKTEDLKEALTVLLNLEFNDLWFVIDKGYDSHQKLRKFITKQWKKEKNFGVLLDKCIKYLK